MNKKIGILSLLALAALIPTACGKKDNTDTPSVNENLSNNAKKELEEYANNSLMQKGLVDDGSVKNALDEEYIKLDQITDINKISEQLINSKAVIDNVIKALESKDDFNLDDYKATKKSELKTYATTEAEKYKVSDPSINAQVEAGNSLIDQANSKENVDTALKQAKENIDLIISRLKEELEKQNLSNAKQQALAEIDQYVNNKLKEFNITSNDKLNNLILDEKTKINQASTILEVNDLKQKAITNIDKVIEEIVNENNLLKLKENNIASLISYKDNYLKELNVAENNDILLLIEASKLSINNTTTISDCNNAFDKAKTDVKALIDQIKAEMDLLNAKETTKLELSNYANSKLTELNLLDDGSISIELEKQYGIIDSKMTILDVTNQLTESKKAIDEAIVLMQSLSDEQRLANAKTNAIQALLEHKTNAYSLNNIPTSQLVEDAYNLGVSEINSKTTIALVNEALNLAKSNIDVEINKILEEIKLQNAKTSSIEQLTQYKNQKLGSLVDDGSVDAALNNGISLINGSLTVDEVNVKYNEAKVLIDNAYDVLAYKEALKNKKSQAINEIKTYANNSLAGINTSSDAEIDSILANYEGLINSQDVLENIDSLVLEAKTKIDERINVLIKIQEELKLANAKSDAINKLTSYYNDKISQVNDSSITNAFNEGKDLINQAKNEAEVIVKLTNAYGLIDDAYQKALLKNLIETKQQELENYAATQISTNGVTDDGTISNIVLKGKEAILNSTNESDVINNYNQAINDIDVAIRLLRPVDNSIVNTLTYEYSANETIALEWSDNAIGEAIVRYKESTQTNWSMVDKELIRLYNGKARVDIVGLKGNVKYDVEVLPGHGGNALFVDDALVEAYDRSGYAHFNYTEGVGAYNDDGSLKNNAIVLYVTDENKNTVTLTYNGVTETGIGNILNSVGQASSTGLTAKGGQPNGNKGLLKQLALDNIPLVVRFIGCVSNTGLYKSASFTASNKPLIDGLTIFDSLDNGGSVGDNGHMARMKSAKNVTLEGIGEDAVIDGWGFHFMTESAYKDLGKSFEVRNLTFINTPEDAIGMEGQQGTMSASGTLTNTASATADIYASVERCWVHNNEFYVPHISGAAESDKSEGDGSVDFKRGQYFTCSYNYFEGLHKTNLVGSSDSSLQYNLTYHHNYWKNCEARGPLARQANIHMYNNVFDGQISYAMNPRANAFIYSEYNLFYLCKNPQDVAGGALKSYNDSFSGIIGACNGTVVTDRTQKVANNCKFVYRNIDYSNFDQDSNLSYIKDLNYNLHDVTEARKYIEAYGGVLRRGEVNPKDVSMSMISISNQTPVKATVPGTLTPGKISKQVYAFSVDRAAKVTTNQDATVRLLNQAGELLVKGSGSAILAPGTYFVVADAFQPGTATSDPVLKDFTINSLTFEIFNSEEFDQQQINDYEAKANNIPSTITYTSDCLEKINLAMDAYNALRAELQAKVTTPYSKVEKAYNDYLAAGINQTISLIDAIGTVNENSGAKIQAARQAYNGLDAVSKAKVTNYQTLVDAELMFEEYAIIAVQNAINAIGSVTLTDESKAKIDYARSSYDALSTEQEKLVNNLQVLVDAENKYNDLLLVDQFEKQYAIYENINTADITIQQAQEISALYTKLQNMTASQKALVVNYETKLARLQELDAYIKANLVTDPVVVVNTKFTTDTYFTVTAPATVGASGLNNTSIMTGKDTVAVSKFTVSNITEVSVTMLSTDKGTTDVKILVSADGNTWTEIASFKNGSNNAAQTYKATVNVEGPVYVKVLGTCTKSSAKTLTISNLTITAIDTPKAID